MKEPIDWKDYALKLESHITKLEILILNDGQIENAGKLWKEALGVNPYRLQADLDFRAGATWVRDIIKTVNEE